MAPFILVLDQSPALRGLLCEILEDEGYRVEGYPPTWGDSALAEREPALIVLDPQPLSYQASDETLCRTIIAQATTARQPLVLCTTTPYSCEKLLLAFPQARYTVVPKPFDIDQLLGAVHRWLGAYPAPLADADNRSHGAT